MDNHLKRTSKFLEWIILMSENGLSVRYRLNISPANYKVFVRGSWANKLGKIRFPGDATLCCYQP